MQILPVNLYNQSVPTKPLNPRFSGKGKPLDLKYIMEHRSYLLPLRVKEAVNEIMCSKDNKKSLLEIHKEIYAPLLDCTTLEEAKQLFPEFSQIKSNIKFIRNSIYARTFKERTDSSFMLKVLQKHWAELKTKSEIAEEFGMPSRNSLEWPLKQAGFVSYKPNYLTLLRASDEEGNKNIADKTRAWNSMHPDLVKIHNKKAAQGCKTPEYKRAQAERMIVYDRENPERREKISRYTKRVWELCPNIKDAMAAFAQKQPAYVRNVIMKKIQGQFLTETESRIGQMFFKRFWRANPELKKDYARARAIASMELRAQRTA